MTSIQIRMFGEFSLFVEGRDFIKYLGSSKKKLELLAYLIINKNKNITAAELYEVLWPNDENSNPESSLKTLISRVRTNLEDFNIRSAIVTKRGYYSWNDGLGAQIDIFELDELYEEISDVEILDKQKEEKFLKAIEIYKGDLLPNFGLDPWVISKSVYWHDKYMSILEKYVKLLNVCERYDDVISVCRKGLDIDSFDSALNLELMTAFLRLGRYKDALSRYNFATGLQNVDLFSNPSEEILEFYKKLIRIEETSDSDVDNIRRELWEDESLIEGAFICDYTIFKEVYRLNMRNIKRLGTSMFIALISIDSIDNMVPDFLVLDRIMDILCETLRKNLRRGDTVSRYSQYQFAILLPTVNQQTGQMVLERVKKEFYKNCSTTQFVMNFKLKPIGIDQ